MASKPLHERVTQLPTESRAATLAADLTELREQLQAVGDGLDDYLDALDQWGYGDREQRAEARDAIAASDLGPDLAALGRFLDGLDMTRGQT